MPKNDRKRRRTPSRNRTRRRGRVEQLEVRRLLAFGALPNWITSPGWWHQGWELTDDDVADYGLYGPQHSQFSYESAGHDETELFVERPEENPELIGGGGGVLPQSAPATLADTFQLHSLPGADQTIYLDFDGHTTIGTTWNSASGNSSIVSPAYDPLNNGSGFNSTELTRIQNIWKRVAEDFSPFDVNVTTEDPGAAALSRSGGSDTQWGTRVVITEDWDNCGCGGFAYVGSFNDSTDEPVFVFNTSETGVAAASSHEVGHALGLGHDGTTSGQSYYGGHGSGETGWGPIMGSGYSTNMTTWDAGDYYLANNSQNDWQIITSNNGFGYRADDHGGSTSAASTLDDLGVNSSDPSRTDVGGFGVIESGSDQDWFQFESGGGTVNFTIDSYVQETFVSTGTGFDRSIESTPVGNQGSNLDIQARIRNSGGSVIATSNPTSSLSASFNNLNLSAGTYYLEIDGVGYGNWAQNPPSGFDQSVSRGQYEISGSVVTAQQVLDARDDNATTDFNTSVNINVLNNDVNPAGGAITITSVSTPADGQIIQSGGVITYTPDLDFSGTDSFTYTITNSASETDTATVVVTVTPPTPPILFVDDDQGAAFERFYTAALDANSLSYDTWTVQASGLPSSGDLAPYSVVVWNTGFNYQAADAGLSSAEQATLSTYLDSGGNLFAIGQDILYNGVSSSFQTDYLKVANYTSDVRGLSAFVGVGGSAISNGMNLPFNLPSDFSADWSDTLAPAAGAEGVFYRNSVNSNSQPYNSVAYGGTDFKVVFMAAPFEGISDSAGNPNNQSTVMGNVIAFFQGGNQPPTATDNNYSVSEDGVLNTGNVMTDSVADSDPDGDPLSVITTPASPPANGTVALSGNGSFTYTPDANFNGSDSFVYTVTDNNGGQDNGTVSITVTPQNDDPVANNATASTQEDTPLSSSLASSANDIDGDSLTFSTVSGPTSGTLSWNVSSYTYTPNLNFNGADSFQYMVDDGFGGQDSAVVSITVAPVNDDPVAGDASVSTQEDTSVSSDLASAVTDVENHPISFGTSQNPSNGSVSWNGSEFTYTPDLNFNGSDSFVYSASDGNGGQGTGTVSVTVTPENDPPVAVDDSFSTTQAVAVSGNVLTHGTPDSDPDGDSLSVDTTTLSGPTSGSVTLNANGDFTYTPGSSFVGTDTFVYRVNDPQGESDEGTVSITVSAVNQPPVAVDDVYTTGEDDPVSGNLLTDGTNDSDPEGDTLTVTGASNPANGSVSYSGNGSFTYTPDPDYFGNDSFEYTISDGNGNSDVGTVSVTVTPVNDVPTIDSVADLNLVQNFASQVVALGGITAGGDESQDLFVTATSSDPGVISNPTVGYITPGDEGTLTLTPVQDATGTVTITVSVTDEENATTTTTFVVTISAPQSNDFYFSRKNSGSVGGVFFENEDIVAYDGNAFEVFFDGTPWVSGYAIDAFAIEASGDILMSFSGAGSIAGGFLSFDDSDIVRYSDNAVGSPGWEMYFDGSDVGLTRSGEDVDAIGFAPDGRLLVSTTGSVRVSGVSAADEDIIAFAATSTGTSTSGSWSLYFDGSDVGLSSSSSEDIDAVSVGSDGTIYVSTTGSFGVSGLSGADEDVAIFEPVTLGSSTTGSWTELYFDGSDFGFTNDIGGMHIADSAPLSASLSPTSARDALTLLDRGLNDLSSSEPTDLADDAAAPIVGQTSVMVGTIHWDHGLWSVEVRSSLQTTVKLLDLSVSIEPATEALDQLFAAWSNWNL